MEKKDKKEKDKANFEIEASSTLEADKISKTLNKSKLKLIINNFFN